jgi:transcriptional regulator with XRE-family HTH domain
MTIYDRVLTLIKEQNLTVKQVERECDLANATIRRWTTQTPNVESARRVAHRLNVTLDYLVEGSSSNTTTGACDGVGLSEMENDLIAMFRLLPIDAQKEVFDLVHYKYSRVNAGEKESIFWTYFDESNNAKSGPAEDAEAQGGTV